MDCPPQLPPPYEATHRVILIYSEVPLDLGCHPAQVVCPHCSQTVTTKTKSRPSCAAWALSGFFCLAFCPCFIIPLCVKSLYRVTHKCPNCKAILAKYKGNGLK